MRFSLDPLTWLPQILSHSRWFMATSSAEGDKLCMWHELLQRIHFLALEVAQLHLLYIHGNGVFPFNLVSRNPHWSMWRARWRDCGGDCCASTPSEVVLWCNGKHILKHDKRHNSTLTTNQTTNYTNGSETVIFGQTQLLWISKKHT